MKFRVILEPDPEDGGYVVTCPALPGCCSQGDTREEALANIRDAIEGYLASLKKRNLPLPMEEEVEVRVP
ncbi:MAG TPA: type II toxin-antitoxin system HicB family antitoxin [Candidatus Acidoferrales bacterium]